MNNPLRILIIILTLTISIINLYFQYELLFKYNQIGYLNKTIKLIIAIITCINLFSIIPSLRFHFTFLLQPKNKINSELLDYELMNSQPTISSYIKLGHILMGTSISFLGFFVLYFLPNLTDNNTFKTSIIYFIILIGFVIITDGLSYLSTHKKAN